MASKPKKKKSQGASRDGSATRDQDKVAGAASEAETASSRLPFEPQSTRPKLPKKAAPTASTAVKDPSSRADRNARSTNTGIPAVVSQRMVRRMGIFCGAPTVLGLLTFVVSYVVVTHEWLKIPTSAVVLVSLGFFGLGVLGLSYGALSASWDEERLGSWLGWQEFTLNFGRMRESWQAAKAAGNDTTPPSA